MKYLLTSLACVLLLTGAAQAAPIWVYQDGQLDSAFTYYASSSGSMTPGQSIGGEDCILVSITTSGQYVRWTAVTPAPTLGENTQFTMTIYVDPQTGVQGVNRFVAKMSGADKSATNLAWYPTAGQWVTYTYDIPSSWAVTSASTVDRLLLYNASQTGGTTFYVKDMGFVPEPATVGILALGSLLMIRRRRSW